MYTKSWTNEEYITTSIWIYIQTHTCMWNAIKIIIDLAYFNISQSDKVKSALPNVYQHLEEIIEKNKGEEYSFILL